MALRRLYMLIAIAVGVTGLAINFWIIVGSGGTALGAHTEPLGVFDTQVYFWTYFTHLTNLGLILVYLADLWPTRTLAWLRHPIGRAAMAGYITLVMVFFHVMLAPVFTFKGGLLIASYLLHYATPLMFLFWWAAFTPHGTLRLSHIPLMLLPGVAYIAWALGRGFVTSEFPYEILDISKAGLGRVAISIAVLIALVTVFCALLVLADRLVGRRGQPNLETAPRVSRS